MSIGTEAIFIAVLKGLFMGACIEIMLWVLPALPLAKVFYNKELRKFSLHDFLKSPKFFYEHKQLLLLEPTTLDNWLSKFLNPKKPMFMGSCLGMGIGLGNYFFKKIQSKNDMVNQSDLQPGITISR